LARVSKSSNPAAGTFGNSAGLVFRFEEFIKALSYFSIVLERGQLNRTEPWRVAGVVHKSKLEAGILGKTAP
jgi:hypothetical protein